ncbi:MAG: hypothetical protein M1297_09155 [Nitrospirae bacterium]|jgi:hypothetical protein|nr:hypothetical protein [Nitrospirota bacterium]
MSRNLSRHFSRLVLSMLAIAGSFALFSAPKIVMADNPAAAPAPQTSAPAAPAKKPMAMKKMKPAVKKHVKKASYKGPSFAGRVVATDLSSTPATIVVSRTLGKKNGTIVFGGDLTSRTVIMKGHKRVKASAIKSGQRVVVHYRKGMGSLTVTSVWIR